jgi:hypothetical protein
LEDQFETHVLSESSIKTHVVFPPPAADVTGLNEKFSITVTELKLTLQYV